MSIRAIRLGIAVSGSLTMTACFSGPGFMKQSGTATLQHGATASTKVEATVAKEENGVLTAAVSAGANVTQVVKASDSSALAGSSIEFPPGALAVSTEITVQEGVPIADSASTQLGLGESADVQSASATVVISSATEMDTTEPFTVSLAIGGGTGLKLQGERAYIVIYQVKKVGTGELVVGIIPTSAITIADGKAVFNTSYFGAYQVATVAAPIAAPVEAPTTAPIVTKTESQQSPLEVADVQPFVAGDGATVTLSGKNIRPGIILAMGGVRVQDLSVKSDSAATFTVPSGVKFGPTDLQVSQDGTSTSLKMFAMSDKSGYPLITMGPSGVCAGVVYYDANGTKQTGTKNCTATATSTGDMTKAVYDAKNNGMVDKADFATEATHALSADTATQANNANYATTAGTASMATYALGGEGTTITAITDNVLTPASNGSFYVVQPDNDVNQISSAPPGTRITLMFEAPIIFNHVEGTHKLLLRDKTSYRYGAGDIAEYMAISGGWREINRTSEHGSRFKGEMDVTGQSISGGAYIDWSNVTHDTQLEYDAATLTFTPKIAGTYSVTARPYFYVAGNGAGKANVTIKVETNNVLDSQRSFTCRADNDNDPSDLTLINCTPKAHVFSFSGNDAVKFYIYYDPKGGPSTGILKTIDANNTSFIEVKRIN